MEGDISSKSFDDQWNELDSTSNSRISRHDFGRAGNRIGYDIMTGSVDFDLPQILMKSEVDQFFRGFNDFRIQL